MNKKLLKSEMVLHGDTGATLASAIGITEQSLSKKINENGSEFTKSEIATIRERYNLSDEKVIAIFFADDVS